MYILYFIISLFIYSCNSSSSDPGCQLETDCAGECGGSAVVDECGVCGGDGIPDGFCDCDGNEYDECGICSGDGVNEGFCDCQNNVLDDCNTCGGDIFFSTYTSIGKFISNSSYVRSCDATGLGYITSTFNCELGSYNDWGECMCAALFPEDCSSNQCEISWICDGYNSPLGDYNGDCCSGFYTNWNRYECSKGEYISDFCDCNGNVLDECGVCGGVGILEGECDCEGNTLDCNEVCGGSAVLDDCGLCGGDNSNCTDCAGVANGDAVEDNCGTCDSDSSNDCIQDCAGEWGGSSTLDDCGVCDGDNSTCTGCTNIYAENYDLNATIDDGSCIESSITLFPDFTALQNSDEYGNHLDSTGVNYSGCYNQNLYFNDRSSDTDNITYSDRLLVPFPNPFDYISNINYELSSSKEFKLFVIDQSNTILNVIVDGFNSSGSYLAQWDGSSNGSLVSDGYYRIIADFGDYECFQNVYFEDNPNGCTDTNACNYDSYTIIDDQSMCSYTECSICDACDMSSNTVYLTSTVNNNGRHSLWFNITDDIYGFQVDVSGINITSVNSSLANEYNFEVQYANGSEFSRILAYSNQNIPIPAGCGNLLEVTFEGNIEEVFNVIIGGEFGSSLNVEYFDCLE